MSHKPSNDRGEAKSYILLLTADRWVQWYMTWSSSLKGFMDS